MTAPEKWFGDRPVGDITQLLEAINAGDRHAADELLPIVYNDLRQLARGKLAGEAPGQSLQATELVHEAYLRLVGTGDQNNWSHRGHFYMAAAEAMRRIFIDRARQKQALKRGGGEAHRVELNEDALVSDVPDERLLDLNEALENLAQKSPQEANLVKLRYFAGLPLEEAAKALGISPATASRYWAFARAYLKSAISDDEANS